MSNGKQCSRYRARRSMPRIARTRRIIRVRRSRVFGADQPLKLDCGIDLSPFQIAYQTYGELNAARSNAILVCHALTGDQHVANVHPVTGKPGWWETMVGPGRPLDTDNYFIICSNVIGGCMGSTGPASTNPATGKLWGLDFPIITIPDMVRAQAMLIDRLGIDTLFCVIGGSMGGMQALQWTAAYPSARVLDAGDRLQHAAFGAEHRVPRTRTAGGDGRSGLASAAAISRRARFRIAGSAWRGWPRISPICRTPRCIASSGGGCRIATCRRFPSMRISRSKAICAIRARRLSSASTPTAISI